jgi:hypothetical protein
MKNNIIEAQSYFLGKVMLDTLDEMLIESNQPHYHPYYLLLEEDGEDFIELRIKDINTNIHTLIDKTPVMVLNDRHNNGEPLFEIG